MRVFDWLKRRRFLVVSITLVIILRLLLNPTSKGLTWADWTGFGQDNIVSKSTETRIDERTKITLIESSQSGKTLWDWLSVLIIPASLAGLGFWFQRLQQKRIDDQATLEKEIANINLREESLQAYFDRLSELLLDKQLVTLAVGDPVREVAFNIIRARTLSIFRRLGEDGERKGSVIQFLYDSEFITKWNLNLHDAHLGHIHLFDTNLSGANLSRTNLHDAIIYDANLSSANLSNAVLNGAEITGSSFYGADLHDAKLCWSNFDRADLSSANLSGAILSYSIPDDEEMDTIQSPARLFSVNLSNTDLSNTNST